VYWGHEFELSGSRDVIGQPHRRSGLATLPSVP